MQDVEFFKNKRWVELKSCDFSEIVAMVRPGSLVGVKHDIGVRDRRKTKKLQRQNVKRGRK